LGFLLCSLLCVASRADRDAEYERRIYLLELRVLELVRQLAEERAQTREAEERIANALHGGEIR
jgi:hypothetical protein